mgnify:CR=1 FL=1
MRKKNDKRSKNFVIITNALEAKYKRLKRKIETANLR